MSLLVSVRRVAWWWCVRSHLFSSLILHVLAFDRIFLFLICPVFNPCLCCICFVYRLVNNHKATAAQVRSQSISITRKRYLVSAGRSSSFSG